MSAPPLLLPLPMFPLNSVLFPHHLLQLHVFEPRYRALARDCLRSGQEFGVVLIERGTEVGGGDARFSVGTVARIVEAVELPDGRWLLGAVGGRRVRIATWLPDDPYPLALVEELPEPRLEDGGSPALLAAERSVRRALALKTELGESAASPTVPLDDDPHVAAYQLAGIAPVGPADQQRLLEAADPEARLRLLAEMASEAADVLAFRLSGA